MAISLETIIDNGLCTGCGACASSIARPDLVMAMNEKGYLRPTTPLLSRTEQKILKTVCPGGTLVNGPTPLSAKYSPLWGSIATLATGYATDPDIRFRGSSGGVITALAITLLEMGEVDFVLTTSADPDDPIGNVTLARHSRDEVLQAAGSRYAPSAPLADLERHLVTGKRFAFIGKPCDVAGLRRMATRDPRIDAQIPYKFAFFCAGVPSRDGALNILRALEVEEANVAAFQFRGNGWPGLAKATLKSGGEASMDYSSSWGTILNKQLQFRCKICPDGIGEFADVVCADAWYGKDGYPDFAERDGRSLIVVRTTVGQALLHKALTRGDIASEPLDIAEVARMQP